MNDYTEFLYVSKESMSKAAVTSTVSFIFIFPELSLKLVMYLICRSLLTFSMKVFNYFSCQL